MEIVGVEFIQWNTILLTINWFALLLSFSIILVFIHICEAALHHSNKQSITIDELDFGIGNSYIKLTFNKKDQEIAYKLWVELSTRKIGLLFDKDHDVITEVYASWYEFFRIARELLKEIPINRLAYSNDLIDLTEKVLNQGLRPHLTVWQAKYRKWYEKESSTISEKSPQQIQRKYPYYDELVDDLVKTNIRMIEYKALMKEIAFRKRGNRNLKEKNCL